MRPFLAVVCLLMIASAVPSVAAEPSATYTYLTSGTPASSLAAGTQDVVGDVASDPTSYASPKATHTAAWYLGQSCWAADYYGPTDAGDAALQQACGRHYEFTDPPHERPFDAGEAGDAVLSDVGDAPGTALDVRDRVLKEVDDRSDFIDDTVAGAAGTAHSQARWAVGVVDGIAGNTLRATVAAAFGAIETVRDLIGV